MLTDPDCRNATCPPDKKRVRLTDTSGLYLEVSPGGSKRWFLKLYKEGKETRLSLGSYPAVTLKAARNARDAAKLQKAEGRDPIETRKLEKLRMRSDEYNHFAATLDADIDSRRSHFCLPYALPGVVLACGTDLTPEPVQWLWKNWLALGKVHILAGAPGQGKTTIAAGALAATVTTGGRWPDGSRCEPGNVIVCSGEDDPSDTLLPRLIAAGGDRSRIFFVQGFRDEGGLHPFDAARDFRELEAAIKAAGGAKLVILDPVVSAVTGDSHKNTEVRRSLQPLVDAAAAGNFAVLGITHFSKGGQGGDPTQRVIGSVAFSAVARVVLVAAKVRGENGEDRRILARSKSNIGPDDVCVVWQAIDR